MTPRRTHTLAAAVLLLMSAAESAWTGQEAERSALGAYAGGREMHAPEPGHSAVPMRRRVIATVDDPAVGLIGDVATADVPVQGGRSARAVERRQRPVAADPAVSGNREGTWERPVPPDMPPQPPDLSPTQGTFALHPAVRFAPVVDVQLAPGASREVELPIDAASVLLASARWIGTTSPLQVSLSLDGTILATGIGGRSAGDSGRAVLRATTAGPGLGALSVTNTSDATVELRLVLGALDRRIGGEE